MKLRQLRSQASLMMYQHTSSALSVSESISRMRVFSRSRRSSSARASVCRQRQQVPVTVSVTTMQGCHNNTRATDLAVRARAQLHEHSTTAVAKTQRLPQRRGESYNHGAAGVTNTHTKHQRGCVAANCTSNSARHRPYRMSLARARFTKPWSHITTAALHGPGLLECRYLFHQYCET